MKKTPGLLAFLGALLPTAAFSAPLKIVSYDVWGPPAVVLRHSERFDKIPAAINALDADVVLIQEAFTSQAKALSHLPRFPYVAKGPMGGFRHFNSGLLILSRYPIRESDAIRYLACGGFDCFSRKGALFARIETPHDGFVDVFNTHLNANGHIHARTSQSRQLLDFVHHHAHDGSPAIFGGDYTRRIDHIFLVDGREKLWHVQESKAIFDGRLGSPVLSDHFGTRITTELRAQRHLGG
jgi:endonuclease/exonuclease/phosphatase family metal-dependent hydrolase